MKIIQTALAPEAIGPYSQAVLSGGLLFCSGQIPLDPETGAMVSGDIEHETARVMKNLGAVLEAAGSGFDKVLKTTIYLVDMGISRQSTRFTGATSRRTILQGQQ